MLYTTKSFPRSRKRRVRDDDFIVGCGRIIVEYSLESILIDFLWTSILIPPNISENTVVPFEPTSMQVSWDANSYSIGGSIQGVSVEILGFKISWEAQYLVILEGDLTGSVHWKWHFKCDTNYWWHWFCVAGAVFWLYWLHILEMRLHI